MKLRFLLLAVGLVLIGQALAADQNDPEVERLKGRSIRVGTGRMINVVQ